MMDLSQRKQQFSFAYIRAVAAAAGYAVSEPSVDDESIDLMVASRGTSGAVKRPRLEVQVKCTVDTVLTEEAFSYALKLKNYDDLRDPDVLVPRILVVVRVPENVEEWTEASDQELLLRHCGYWLSLRGMDATTNTTSVTLTLPRANQFTPAALTEMMARISDGGTP